MRRTLLLLISVLCLAPQTGAAKQIAAVGIQYRADTFAPSAIHFFNSQADAAQIQIDEYCRDVFIDNCTVTNLLPISPQFFWAADFTFYHRSCPSCSWEGPVSNQTTNVVRLGCPQGYFLHNNSYCWSSGDQLTPSKNKGEPAAGVCVGNPIHPGFGNKFQTQDDYVGSGANALVFRRYYNSNTVGQNVQLGDNWRHHYDRTIAPATSLDALGVGAADGLSHYVFWAPAANDPTPLSAPAIAVLRTVMVIRADGKTHNFTDSGAGWTPEADVNAKLIQLVNASGQHAGWQYTTADNEIEIYDVKGKLLSITNRAGLSQTLTYSDASTPTSIAPVAGLLLRVTDAFGRPLNFTYDSASRIKSLTDSAGGVYQYTYDIQNNLASVTYPGTGTRSYLYNEPAYTANTNLPHALTGIIDENGVRFASWSYDSSGRAISSEHTGGAEKVSLAYNADGTTTVWDYKDSAALT
jgi:YD repeat-containing protein